MIRIELQDVKECNLLLEAYAALTWRRRSQVQAPLW